MGIYLLREGGPSYPIWIASSYRRGDGRGSTQLEKLIYIGSDPIISLEKFAEQREHLRRKLQQAEQRAQARSPKTHQQFLEFKDRVLGAMDRLYTEGRLLIRNPHIGESWILYLRCFPLRCCRFLEKCSYFVAPLSPTEERALNQYEKQIKEVHERFERGKLTLQEKLRMLEGLQQEANSLRKRRELTAPDSSFDEVALILVREWPSQEAFPLAWNLRLHYSKYLFYSFAYARLFDAEWAFSLVESLIQKSEALLNDFLRRSRPWGDPTTYSLGSFLKYIFHRVHAETEGAPPIPEGSPEAELIHPHDSQEMAFHKFLGQMGDPSHGLGLSYRIPYMMWGLSRARVAKPKKRPSSLQGFVHMFKESLSKILDLDPLERRAPFQRIGHPLEIPADETTIAWALSAYEGRPVKPKEVKGRIAQADEWLLERINDREDQARR